MFGTLRYDAQNDDTHFIERTTDPLNGKGEGQRPRYSACDKCRAKKQRCGGRRDGCERCIRTSSECVYSLQGKGRGRRRRNATEGKDFSLGASSSPDPAKKSTTTTTTTTATTTPTTKTKPTEKPQQRQTPPPPPPPPTEITQNMNGLTDDPMSSFMAVDGFENDFPTSGLMQSDMLPGFDGQSIDDYLDGNYMSTMPTQQDFDPDFYFGNNCDSFENTPIDSLSDISSIFDQSKFLPSRSDFDLNSYVSRSPLSSVQSYSDGLPSPQSTPQARPTTPVGNPFARKDSTSTATPDSCRCLNTMVMLLEDLETKGRHVDTAALDSILVSQKEALGRCNTVLNCSSCFLRPEYILLLGMVAERLATLCESTVAKYLEDTHEGTSFHESAINNPIHDVKVCLGGYEIETPDERVGLVRLMIVMQLQSLRKFVEGVSIAVASRREGKTQVGKVQAAEQRLAKLIQRIRQSKI